MTEAKDQLPVKRSRRTSLAVHERSGRKQRACGPSSSKEGRDVGVIRKREYRLQQMIVHKTKRTIYG